MTITVGSLFSGIGGMDLGLERAGMKVVWQSEIDDYACRVLKKHWPDVPNLGDITKITEAPHVDLICGGFPCQDISCAGKGEGIHGSRSSLWFEMLRVVGLVRPRLILVENVARLLKRGMGTVLGGLADLGYDAEWHRISAASVGAPHLRNRIFIVAYAKEQRAGDECENFGQARREINPPYDTGRACRGANRQRDGENVAYSQGITERTGLREGEPGRQRGRRSGNRSCEVADSAITNDRVGIGRAIERQREELGEGGIAGRGPWATEPNVGRVAHGVPSRVDRLRCIGNAVVPQVAEWIGRRIVEAEKR